MTTIKDDLISRQAAIETVKKHYRVDNDLLEVIAYEIEAMPSAQPGWIPCKTALPEHDGEYLVTIKAFTPDQVVYTDIDIARFTDGKWRKGFPVTAWCELPKPWEGEKS